MTIYRYGWMAWIWRVLALGGLLASGALVAFALRFEDWIFLAIALPLAVPSIVFPWMLAVRIDRDADDDALLLVTNLFFVRRRIAREALGRPRVRQTAQGTVGPIAAPRAWVPVRGSWPIYLDLFAEIPDPALLRAIFGLPRSPAT